MYEAFPKKYGSFHTENGLNLFWKDPIGKARAYRGWPVQVYSCWNGAVILNSEPFYQHPELQFRRSRPNECSESECSLLSKDLWNLGYGRIMVVPYVTVSYNLKDFKWAKSLVTKLPFYANKLTDLESECDSCSSKLNWTFSNPKYVVCYPLDEMGTRGADWEHPFWILNQAHQTDS